MLGQDLARAGLTPGSAEVTVVVEMLIAGVDGVARWWSEHPEVTLDDVAAPVTALLWNGLPRAGR